MPNNRVDMSNARRGAVIPATGKTRVTMYIDDDVLHHFREIAEQSGRGYQTVINSCLRNVVDQSPEAVSSKDDAIEQRLASVESVIGTLALAVDRLNQVIVNQNVREVYSTTDLHENTYAFRSFEPHKAVIHIKEIGDSTGLFKGVGAALVHKKPIGKRAGTIAGTLKPKPGPIVRKKR